MACFAADEMTSKKQRVFVAGATGYIGRHVAAELVRRGHDVVCFARKGPQSDERLRELGAAIRFGDVTSRASIEGDGLRGETFDVVVSCLASRSGAPKDAWLVEHQANANLLEACKAAGTSHFVLLSAICVQKPLLEFQHAKLAFERALIASGLTYSIVRPTAFFKSLAGQVKSVKRGKPFVVFGDGELTSCKPISERDLACFLADCLDDASKHDAILPIGGPGKAITPKEQGALLCKLAGHEPRYRHVPVRLLDAIIFTLGAVGRLSPSLRDKAELARIGRYYATESMLVLDQARGVYDADQTPSYGEDTLHDFYAHVLEHGLAGQELGEHAVFSRE